MTTKTRSALLAAGVALTFSTAAVAQSGDYVLGVQMRGYHGFGCALQDPKGGCKAKGEA